MTHNRIDVMPVATPVVVGGDIPGTITQIIITNDGVRYEVAWWDGKSRKTEWMYRHEIKPANHNRMPIGFERVNNHGAFTQ